MLARAASALSNMTVVQQMPTHQKDIDTPSVAAMRVEQVHICALQLAHGVLQQRQLRRSHLSSHQQDYNTRLSCGSQASLRVDGTSEFGGSMLREAGGNMLPLFERQRGSNVLFIMQAYSKHDVTHPVYAVHWAAV